MSAKKNLRLALVIPTVLFLIGVFCYAAFPMKAPEKPVRKMFKGAAGKVLFKHKEHFSNAGFAVSCADCHHHPQEEGAEVKACGDCHKAEIANNTVPKDCLECHEPDENHHDPENEELKEMSCNDCHLSQDDPEGDSEGDSEMPETCSNCHEEDEVDGQPKLMGLKKRSDAFHGQCIGCHKESDAGPVECNDCHVR